MSFAALAEQVIEMAGQYGYKPRLTIKSKSSTVVKRYTVERVAIIEYLKREGAGQKQELMRASGLRSQGYRTTMESLRASGAIKAVMRNSRHFWVIA